jgi:hypothetical protein
MQSENRPILPLAQASSRDKVFHLPFISARAKAAIMKKIKIDVKEQKEDRRK